MRKLVLLPTIALLLFVACQKAEEPVPTEKDGEQVWHNLFSQNGAEPNPLVTAEKCDKPDMQAVESR